MGAVGNWLMGTKLLDEQEFYTHLLHPYNPDPLKKTFIRDAW